MKHLALALPALALISCSPSPSEAKPAAHPALWKVADADTTVYLFGTIHLLPKDLTWSGKKIDAAVAKSDALVLEAVLDKDPAVTGAIMAKLGIAERLPPVIERVPADKRAALKRVIDKSGVSVALLNRLETWAAALALASNGMKGLGVDPAFGVENVLRTRFEKAGKPVTGLETAAVQLGYFDALPESAQRVFLSSIADDDAGAQAELNAMIGAWTAGDVKRIAVTFDDELKLSPELSDALLRQRNARWAAWVAERMAKPGTVFVAVGAGHLAGAGSVEELLTKRGLKVSRVQ